MKFIHRLTQFTNRLGYGRLAPLQREAERLRREAELLRLSLRQVRNFAGAASNRLVEDWFSTRTSINNLLESGLPTMRERSRKLVRDDNYARKFIGMVRNNVVGPEGFNLELDIRDEKGSVDQRAVDQIKRAWEKWSKGQNCSVTRSRLHSYWGICNLITETSPASGGFLVRKVRGYDNPFKFALQVIATDCLDESVNRAFDGNTAIRMGVESDKWGAAKFYHIKTENPYDNLNRAGRNKQTERVPASEIIHGFIPMEVDQARELPWFHCSMIGLQMLGGYDEAALVAARIGASKSLWFQKKMDPNQPYVGDGTDAAGNRQMDVAPGEVGEVPEGWEMANWEPAYPHAEHGGFNKVVLRGIAAGLLVSYNSLANDLEGVNYSSLRAGLLEERDQWKVLQRWEREVFHDDVFENWLDMAMLTGEVNLPQFKFDKFNRPYFMGRRWPWVDPLKDIQAKILAIQNALDSNTDTVAESGGSFEELLATIENDLKMMQEKGIVVTGLKGSPEPEVEAASAESGTVESDGQEENGRSRIIIGS